MMRRLCILLTFYFECNCSILLQLVQDQEKTQDATAFQKSQRLMAIDLIFLMIFQWVGTSLRCFLQSEMVSVKLTRDLPLGSNMTAICGGRLHSSPGRLKISTEIFATSESMKWNKPQKKRWRNPTCFSHSSKTLEVSKLRTTWKFQSLQINEPDRHGTLSLQLCTVRCRRLFGWFIGQRFFKGFPWHIGPTRMKGSHGSNGNDNVNDSVWRFVKFARNVGTFSTKIRHREWHIGWNFCTSSISSL